LVVNVGSFPFLWIGVKIPVLKTFGIFPDCMILLHKFTCEYRYSLINNIVQHTANQSINTKFNEEDIQLSIGKLNTSKTSDGCTLTAEHFKYAGESIVPSMVNLFNKTLLPYHLRRLYFF
jgi:hypothetical protein